MQTMRQAQHATPASRRHTDTHKVHKSRFKHPREWTWLSTIPVRNPAGVDYSGNSQFNLIADILRGLHQCGSRQTQMKKKILVRNLPREVEE